VLCNVLLNTPIACSLVCFPGMTSSLAKLNKSSGAHFLALFLKFPNFLMFLNILIDLLILKTYYGQFTLTTKEHCISSKKLQMFAFAAWRRSCIAVSSAVMRRNINSLSSRTTSFARCLLTYWVKSRLYVKTALGPKAPIDILIRSGLH